jgi:hypothetical protein
MRCTPRQRLSTCRQARRRPAPGGQEQPTPAVSADVSQFRGHRHFPVVISDDDESHGRQVHGTLRARNAADSIRERCVGASWIAQLMSNSWQDSKPFHHLHFNGLRPTSSTSPPGAPVRKRCCGLCASAGRSKTSGTGPATPSLVRTLTTTPIATACRF